eukprot:4987723-Amphidinium_carterae.1
MINNVILDLEENHIITVHSLTVNADKNEKAIQLSTADVILQAWYLDVSDVDPDKLKKAMLHELNQLKGYDVYEEVNIKSLSPEQVQSIIKTWWVIAERSGPTGEVSIKARFVGKGYTQSMDPESVYAGTPHMSSLKILLVMACKNSWTIATSDISGAFLRAPLTDEGHVTPPPEIYSSEAQSGIVWKLKRALYGLRQAPTAWQQHLTQ